LQWLAGGGEVVKKKKIWVSVPREYVTKCVEYYPRLADAVRLLLMAQGGAVGIGEAHERLLDEAAYNANRLLDEIEGK
jgi:hypothetical protein